MTVREEVNHVFELAQSLLNEKEPIYGDSWKRVGLETCFQQIPRKSTYLAVQYGNGHVDEKFMKDLLDLMNWCAMVYVLLEGKGGQEVE